MPTLFRWSNRVFDAFESWWEGPEARRMVASVLVGGFLGALVLIEASRRGLLPPPLDTTVATNHFVAIDVAFTLFLIVELVGLVVGLATSVADTAGKQFEVFSLILLRRSFKELVEFDREPIQWSFEAGREAVQFVVVDATGALLIFLTLGVFYTLQQHQPITQSRVEQRQFVSQKKLVANTLLLVLVGLGVYSVAKPVVVGETVPFFNAFYTVLIFSDVLIVLISLRYSATYHVVFRNSGFAAATVMIRLALAGPRYLGTALGVLAALFNLGVAAAYTYVAPAALESRQRKLDRRAEADAAAGAPTEEDAGTPL
jgi:succinate dehydrogenase hydrophobic anchor subunit